MKLVLTFIFIFNLSNSLANEIQTQKPVDKWKLLMNLINQEISTITKARKKTSGLKYRLLELQSEKIKLWKKKENDQFMQKSIKGIKISRKNAFKTTLKHYEEARRLGLSIVKKHPNTRYKAAIYYTLALNSRDYAYDNREYGYLIKALTYAPQKSEIRYLTRTSLAEYYYNTKKYQKAVNLYKKIIINKNDEWLTKNLYNYGWCLLKTHKFNEAIETLENAYALSTQEYYIDFREQIMDGLVNFYVLGKQVNRGKEFILSKVENKYEALFKYLKKVSSKGYKAESNELISLTESYIDPKKRTEQLGDLRLFQFDFHKQFNEKDQMYNIAKALSELKLSPEQNEEATLKVAEEVGIQQQIIKSEFSKHDKSYEVTRLERILSYFKLLETFDNKNEAKYKYYSAETLYTVHEFPRALKFYKSSLETQLVKESDFDLNKKAVDSIFSCIEFSQFSKKEEQVELEYAYTKHLDLWPKDKKSQKIYSKLFTLYLFQKRYINSQSTLDLYTKSFKKDKEIQQELFKQQLDFLIKEEEVDLIASKIDLMYKGYLGFTFEDTKKSEKILATILFNRYQKLNNEGKKEEALLGYQSIFYKENYPKSVRADAAFNMGIIYIDLFDSTSGIKWFRKSIPLFTEDEKVKRRDYLDKVSLRSSLLQDFLNAANIQKVVLDVFCSTTKEKNLKSFQDAIIYDLANDYVDKAIYTYDNMKKCIKGDTKFINEYILTHLFNFNHESDFLSFSLKPEVRNQFPSQIGSYYENYIWKYKGKNITKEKLFTYHMKGLDCETCKVYLETNEKFVKFEELINKKAKETIKIAKPFNPEKFNSKLSARLESIKPVVNLGEDILKIGHPEISIKTYDLMAKFIITVSDEIRNIEVPVEDQDFQKQFKDQMTILSSNILKQKSSLAKRANAFISQNNILSHGQKDTHHAFEVLQISDIRMPASITVSTLDLGE